MVQDGAVPLDVWNGMSDAEKLAQIKEAYSIQSSSYDEAIDYFPLDELMDFMVEQPHHIQVPWWMDEGYETEKDMLNQIKEGSIVGLQEDIANPRNAGMSFDDDEEYNEWIAEQNERIKEISSWRYLDDVDYDTLVTYGKNYEEELRTVWEDFIVFDSERFDRDVKPWYEQGQAMQNIGWHQAFEDYRERRKANFFKCSCECNDGRIHKNGTRQYLKTFSDEAYLKYLHKDSFGFLRHNADEILEVLTVGRDVADYFKTCSIQQVKEIYIGIIETIQQGRWSVKEVRDAVSNANPNLTDYEVSRIVQTELQRILLYAREQLAIRNQKADARYQWVGPLDDRTTPLCRFMQTGELRGEYRYMGGTYNLESLRDQLPEWRDDGWLLPELKEILREVWAVFNAVGLITTPMVGEWIAHINCRHSFQVVSNILIEEGLIEEYEIPDMIDSYVTNEDNLMNTMMTLSGYESIPITAVTGIEEGVAFTSGNNLRPIIYAPTDEYESPITFVFRSVNERQASEWARLILQLRDSDVDDVSIIWLLQDESGMNDDEIDYIFAHAETVYAMSDGLDWAE